MPSKTPQEQLKELEARIARLDRRIHGGLTCCGEIGGIRSRSVKRKNQIADGRVTACGEIVKLYPLRDRLRETVERMARGEPEPVAPPSRLELLAAQRREQKAAKLVRPVAPARRFVMLPPKVTATFTDTDAANAYMETHEFDGVLKEQDGVIELADIRDLGTKQFLDEQPPATAPKRGARI